MARELMGFNAINGVGLTRTKATIVRFAEQWSENFLCYG
jgi:hypothetical protein